MDIQNEQDEQVEQVEQDEQDKQGEIEGGTVAMLVLLVILIFLLVFFCLMPYFRAMFKRWKHWDDPENDPRWNTEHFQFSTSPKLDREPNYNRLSNSTLDKLSNGGTSSIRGSRMGSRVGSRVGINMEGSFRNLSGLPRDPEQVEIKIPPSFADFLNQGSVGNQDMHPAFADQGEVEPMIKPT
eukprot:GFUD01016064.1.p1 GENE.GFUD01016064.1~~GFUD01016064.1.p1  ORF type:complete len:183 (-),score=49.76 GFUD01016064.1:422-970(-)